MISRIFLALFISSSVGSLISRSWYRRLSSLYLKVPNEVLLKTPSDGLSNKSDEDKLGVSYNDIALYMEDKNKLDKNTQTKIEKLHKYNLHKFVIPTYKKG